MAREKSPQRVLLDRVKNDFAQHPASPQNDAVRADFGRLAAKMVKVLPPGREQSLVLTKLEEAMFWANAAIARSQQEPAASSDVLATARNAESPKKRTAKRPAAKKSTRRPRRPEPVF